MPQPATRGTNSEVEDENENEEEEEQEINIYMDRDVELAAGESSCQNSGDVSGNSTAAPSGDSGSLTAEVLETEVTYEVEVTYGGLDQDEAKAEGAEIFFMPEGGQTGVQRHVTVEVEEEEEEEEEQKKEEEVCDSSGNVNLFSVTLAALAVCEEEEEEEQNIRNSLTDFLKQTDLKPLLPTDSQTESGDHTTVAFMLPTQEDFTATGYEIRHADTLSGCLKTCDGKETQEEKEEEFSAYMGHALIKLIN